MGFPTCGLFGVTPAVEAADKSPDTPPVVDVPPKKRARLDSVDKLRGLVMVIMALDHARDFFWSGRIDPTDLQHTTVALFLTRLITHYCAPVFVFLAGTGAFLYGSRGKTKGEVSRFLLTRGLWLILLEATVIKFAWSFNPDPHFIMFQVIWAIGVSMVVLSALIYLPLPIIGALGILMIVGHNALDSLKVAGLAQENFWTILHHRGTVEWLPGYRLFILYPLIPWIGVMAAGYAFGALMVREPEARRQAIFRLGLGLTLAFVALRLINVYGDPQPWSAQPSPVFTLLSFFNCQKYPPSLLYLLMTLGPALLVLALFERGTGRFGRVLETYGRVPLFYYVLHLYLLHGAAVVFAIARYGSRAATFNQNNLPAD